MVAVHRHFVGWDQPAIGVAAAWLVAKYGADMSRVVVALPGARAGRSLLAALVAEQAPDWQPPRIVTAAGLTDELIRLEQQPASRLLRTRAWEHALRTLRPGDIEGLVARRPADDDGKTWRGLATEVRALFAVLAAECMDFGSVSVAMTTRSEREQRRWQALLRAQESAEAFLREAGQCDPHRGRLAALERGDLVDAGREVVLVGVVEAIGLVRRLVESLEHVTALVFAPEEEGEAFDAMGCLVPAVWLERRWALPVDAWRIASGPDDQARTALGIVAGWEGRYPPEQITIGVGDAAVTPFVERRLTEQGVFARDAGGSGHSATPPARLLAGVAAVLGHERFVDLAALVRHPDVEDLLTEQVDLEGLTCPAVLDGYHEAHLPGRLPEPWLRAVNKRNAGRDQLAGRLGAAVQEWLAPLRGGERPTSQWAAPLREVLSAVYGERVFDPERSADRLVCAGLTGLADALTCIEELPANADFDTTATDALELVLEEAAAHRIPARAPEVGEPTIEMLGWLELAFDPAPALVVTGFNEGFVPEAVKADGWLPDTLRAELGLPQDQSRLARDLYTLEWITRSHQQALLVSGRRSLDGDPLRPSRLAFRGSPTEVLERVRHFLADAVAPVTPPASSVCERELPLPGELSEPTAWSATSFGAYLQSPYVFALQRLADLQTLDDRAQEMGPMLFGTVGHEVLRRFGSSELAASTDAEAIASFLVQTLDEQCARQFGDAALPAVQLQRRQLAWRLRLFARDQAARVQEGWRIERVEWRPDGEVTLDVDGEAVAVTGQIDRIDRHENGDWAILDYKFSEKAKSPERAHQSGGEWINVQLPVYAHLARELIGEDMPMLGYWSLGATAADCGVRMASKWDAASLEDALSTARDVVRSVRAQLASDSPIFELGRPYLRDTAVLADVCGVGLFSDAEMEADA